MKKISRISLIAISVILIGTFVFMQNNATKAAEFLIPAGDEIDAIVVGEEDVENAVEVKEGVVSDQGINVALKKNFYCRRICGRHVVLWSARPGTWGEP